MNPLKCDEYDYIYFLLAHPTRCTGTEASRVQPSDSPKSHDCYTALLHRLNPNTDDLWNEVRSFLHRQKGALILDDSTIDKPYAQAIELVGYHWSGKQKRTVKGIHLLTLLWTVGDLFLPTAYRIYDKPNDSKTKNDHFRDLLDQAKQRQFGLEFVVFDSWYCSLENLKHLRKLGYRWLTRFKSNRIVNPDNKQSRAICECAISPEGTIVYLQGYGFVKVFRIDIENGDTQYWASSDLDMQPLMRVKFAELSWNIEEYHRGLKQHCLVEKAQVRKTRAQRNHIVLAIRAFVRFQRHQFRTRSLGSKPKWTSFGPLCANSSRLQNTSGTQIPCQHSNQTSTKSVTPIRVHQWIS